MRHWHRCERWERRGLPCPFSSLAQHETEEGDPPDDEPGQVELPDVVDTPQPVVIAARQRERGKINPYRRVNWPSGAPGLPDPEWIEEVLGDGYPSPEEAPEPVGPVPYLPVPLRPAAGPRPPPLRVAALAQEPYRNPFANPELMRALARMRQSTVQRVRGSAKAVSEGRSYVPQGWKPTQQDVRGLRLSGSAADPGPVRAAMGEEIAVRTIQSSERPRTSRLSKSRLAVAAATLAAAGAGAYAASRGGGGGGFFHVNMAAWSKELIGAAGRRSYSQNTAGRQFRGGL